MINRKDHPIGWALMLQELEDAHEHLGKLIDELDVDDEYDEHNLRVDLGHVYAHLNRAWRRRFVSEDFTDEEWESARCFPNDIQPVA